MRFAKFLCVLILFLLSIPDTEATAIVHKNSKSNPSDSLRKMIQFSGAVVTADSLKSIPYANILVYGRNRGASANFYGFFSIVAYAGDTITFSAQGYRNAEFVIPDTLQSDHYSMFQMMQTDTILLQETVIYPWPNIKALEHAIVYAPIPETDYDRAMKNLEREKLKERGLLTPMDGSMNYRNQIQNVVNKSYYNGQYVPISLLNPFAWAKFFKAWKEGKFKKKDND